MSGTKTLSYQAMNDGIWIIQETYQNADSWSPNPRNYGSVADMRLGNAFLDFFVDT